MSEKIQFEQSKELLKQVFCDQAGDIYKGIMEAVQNLSDGIFEAEEKGLLNRENSRIEVNTDGEQLVIGGNGIGMTDEDANGVFKIFGISQKRGNKNRLGEKGMGRGQIISMVYDSADDSMVGSCEVISGNREVGGSIRIFDIDVPSLTFRVENPGTRFKGTKWILTKNEGNWNTVDIKKYVEENLAMLPIPIYVNQTKMNKKITKEKFERVIKTDDAVIGLNRWGTSFTLYERGLKVNEYDILSGYSGTIISKVPLKLNFARNDVKHDDRSWMGIRKDLKDELLRMALSTKDSSLDGNKVDGLLEALSNDEFSSHDRQEVLAKKMFVTALGDRLSLNDIQRKGNVVWGSNRSRKSDAASRCGHIVIPHTWEADSVFEELGVEAMQLEDVHISQSDAKQFERHEIPQYKIELIYFLEQYSHRRIEIGKSPGFKAWTNGTDRITWNDTNIPWDKVKDAIKTGNWDTVFWKMVKTLSHELAHDDNDEFTDVHGVEFYQRQVDEMYRITKEYFRAMKE